MKYNKCINELVPEHASSYTGSIITWRPYCKSFSWSGNLPIHHSGDYVKYYEWFVCRHEIVINILKISLKNNKDTIYTSTYIFDKCTIRLSVPNSACCEICPLL